MSEQIKVNIDDVVTITQMMTTIIQSKRLKPEEFKTIRGSWEALVDSIAQLQRRTVINKLYAEEPPSQVTSSDLSIPATPTLPSSLPTDTTNVSGVQEAQ